MNFLSGLNFNIFSDDWAYLPGAFAGFFGRMFYYLIICGLGRVADICQLIFRKFAGISENGVQINGVQTNGDIVYAFLQSSIVRNLFFALLILAVIILLIATFTAVIKTEFAKDGNNNKRKVIKNAFRGLANFFLVPIICLFGVFMGNAILRAIDGATSTGAQMLSSQVFIAGAYNGNRMRMSEMNSSDQRYKEGSFGAFVAGTTGSDVNGYSNFGYFLDDTTGLNPCRAADKIDGAFAQGRAIVVGKGLISSTDYDSNEDKSGATQQFDSPSQNSRTIYYEGTADIENGMWFRGMLLNGVNIDYTSDGTSKNTSVKNKLVLNEGDVIKFSIYNVGLVYYYYDLSFAGFNYLIGGIAMCFCAWTLLVTVLGLIKRIFMLSTLFIVSAPVCAIYPLDDGKALGTWRGEFIKETLSAYAVVVVMNIFLALLPLIQSITLFIGTELGILQGFANYMAQVLIVLAGLSFFKDATKTISNIIGAGNAYDAGDGAKKAFAANVHRTAAGVALGAGVVKGAARAVGGIDKGIHNGLSWAAGRIRQNGHANEQARNDVLNGLNRNNDSPAAPNSQSPSGASTAMAGATGTATGVPTTGSSGSATGLGGAGSYRNAAADRAVQSAQQKLDTANENSLQQASREFDKSERGHTRLYNVATGAPRAIKHMGSAIHNAKVTTAVRGAVGGFMGAAKGIITGKPSIKDSFNWSMGTSKFQEAQKKKKDKIKELEGAVESAQQHSDELADEMRLHANLHEGDRAHQTSLHEGDRAYQSTKELQSAEEEFDQLTTQMMDMQKRMKSTNIGNEQMRDLESQFNRLANKRKGVEKKIKQLRGRH